MRIRLAFLLILSVLALVTIGCQGDYGPKGADNLSVTEGTDARVLCNFTGHDYGRGPRLYERDQKIQPTFEIREEYKGSWTFGVKCGSMLLSQPLPVTVSY